MKENEIGGLWLNESQKGTKYMAGTLKIDGKEVKVLVFKNSFKQPGERTPDYRVYLQQPREQAGQQSAQAAPDNFDEIPF